MVNFPPAPDFLGMEFGGERKRTTNARFVCIFVSNHIVKLRSPKDDDVSPMIHISATTGSGYNNRKLEKGLHKPNQWVFKMRGSFAWSAWATTVQVRGEWWWMLKGRWCVLDKGRPTRKKGLCPFPSVSSIISCLHSNNSLLRSKTLLPLWKNINLNRFSSFFLCFYWSAITKGKNQKKKLNQNRWGMCLWLLLHRTLWIVTMSLLWMATTPRVERTEVG